MCQNFPLSNLPVLNQDRFGDAKVSGVPRAGAVAVRWSVACACVCLQFFMVR